MTSVPLPTANPNLMSLGQDPRPTSGTPPSTPFGPAGTIGKSVIGTDLTILGQNITIISKNRLQIDGDIRGDVSGKQIIISADGSVIGTVCAERVEIYGGVKGAIRAAAVVLHPSAQVDAEILHTTISIAEGALVEGRFRKPRNESDLIPNLDANAYALRTPSPV